MRIEYLDISDDARDIFVEYAMQAAVKVDPYRRLFYTGEVPTDGLKSFREPRKLNNYPLAVGQLMRDKMLEVFDPDVIKVIQGFREGKTEGVVVLRNMPIDREIPGTPSDDKHSPNKGFVSEFTIMGVSALLNARPNLDQRFRKGSPIHQIVPKDGVEGKTSNDASSKASFPVHTDRAFEIDPDRYVALLALRGNPDAENYFVSRDEIIEAVPTARQSELYKPNFKIARNKEGLRIAKPVAILTEDANGNKTHLRINLNPEKMIALTPEAEQVLQIIHGKFGKHGEMTKVSLGAGDMALIDNWAVGHGRSSFDMKSEVEERRWIQRVQLVTEDQIRGL